MYYLRISGVICKEADISSFRSFVDVLRICSDLFAHGGVFFRKKCSNIPLFVEFMPHNATRIRSYECIVFVATNRGHS